MSKLISFVLCLFLSFGCALKSPLKSSSSEPDLFNNVEGCFLLFNMKTKQYEKKLNEENCNKRSPAYSTFKVPLAVMAFDSGVLKDENEVYIWDKVQRDRKELNQNHNAQTFMRDSVVWFSQRLTPQIGKKRMQKYLQDFEFGNQSLVEGIHDSWLLHPDKAETALAISPYEQIQFLVKLWTNSLPASDRAQRLTRKITFLEESPQGFQLSGKTGSVSLNSEGSRHLGWFVAHLQKGEIEYAVVTRISDKEEAVSMLPGGPRAKQITKQMLDELGLW